MLLYMVQELSPYNGAPLYVSDKAFVMPTYHRKLRNETVDRIKKIMDGADNRPAGQAVPQGFEAWIFGVYNPQYDGLILIPANLLLTRIFLGPTSLRWWLSL